VIEHAESGLAEKAEVHRFRDRCVEIVIEDIPDPGPLRAASLAARIMVTGVGHPSS
jgi:hypothetical protein